jgi:hypothetical protein
LVQTSNWVAQQASKQVSERKQLEICRNDNAMIDLLRTTTAWALINQLQQ